MKTLRKAILGLIFLTPLFLPSQTKAGPIGDWLHSFFDNRPLPPQDYHPNPYFDRGRDLGYRPYDPSHGNPGAGQSGNPGDPGSPNAVPIDGGLIFLLAAGLGLGLWKMYEFRKRAAAALVQ
jgi:hypothetical protein